MFQPIRAQNYINGNVEKGASLFKTNCTSCHSPDLTKKLIGPALYGVTNKRNSEWLHKWIKNNKDLIKRGDKDAISIYKEYGKIDMNPFPQLSDKDIDDILSFIKNTPSHHKEKLSVEKTSEIQPRETLIRLVILGFSVLSVILLLLLLRIYTLVRIIDEESHDRKKKIPIGILEKYRFIGYILIGVFFLSSIFVIWDFLMNIDVNKGYQPNQPIYFSHKIHSNINQIDCQYCHSSAKYGKVSGIPSANICMNCHVSITEYNGDYIENGKDKIFYTKEIQKIYKAIGWDPNTRTYSNETHPIKWIRIHNMPDFVYFDHSQHVVAGEETIKKSQNVDVVCKACHGEVQDMDKVKMVNDFTMGWCINCHRTTEVNMDNKYYVEYFNKLHEKLKKQYNGKNPVKVTVDSVGGIECGKCHY
ncbi:cytochrome c [Candidatus Walczuchella monophlebidarum]|uniref:Cytochrome c n=1 Tax=Candidatus Walczuchella monophlebidarum TaxID=1415657 RepID=A0A068DQF6_9FLAO|nr:cytochrome c [Candidatus Walczuchella monophlebidarum]